MYAQIDFTKQIRPIGKLNGANNGPLHSFTDRTAEYKDMGIDFVRFHETHSVFTKCVEIPFIFPDFDADENDPANYFFGETDAVMTAAYNSGMEIMYRLGMGTEGSKPKLFCVIPKDYAKWARIAEHIIMHYNEGWADGFHYNIEYWEVWNEADIKEYWPGEHSEYVKFYNISANHLKKRFPHIKIGCSGFAWLYPEIKPDPEKEPERAATYDMRYKFFHDFLASIADGSSPMDFFAWHIYAFNSAICAERLRVLNKLLSEFDLLGKVEVINTEWNAITLHKDSKGRWNLAQMVTMKSAIAVVACMIVMQKNNVTKAAYYDADERSRFCGLYDFEKKGNHYYSLKIFNLLRNAETEVESEGDTDTFRVCGATNGKIASVLLTNEDESGNALVKPKGIPSCNYTLTLFDSGHKLEVVRRGRFSGRAISVPMEKNSAAYLEFDLTEEA